MIGWIIDRVWAWKNRAALDALDQESDELQIIADRLAVRMAEAFGPDWRRETEERLARLSGLSPPPVAAEIDRSPNTWWRNRAGEADCP